MRRGFHEHGHIDTLTAYAEDSDAHQSTVHHLALNVVTSQCIDVPKPTDPYYSFRAVASFEPTYLNSQAKSPVPEL